MFDDDDDGKLVFSAALANSGNASVTSVSLRDHPKTPCDVCHREGRYPQSMISLDCHRENIPF